MHDQTLPSIHTSPHRNTGRSVKISSQEGAQTGDNCTMICTLRHCLLRWLKSQTMRWAWHAERIKKINTCVRLVEISEEHRLPGRPKCRWNNTKLNLIEFGIQGVDRIQLAQNRHVVGWCEHGNEPWGGGFHKMRRIWLAEKCQLLKKEVVQFYTHTHTLTRYSYQFAPALRKAARYQKQHWLVSQLPSFARLSCWQQYWYEDQHAALLQNY